MLPVTAALAERHTGEKEIKQEVRVGSGPRIASPDSTTAFKETATRSRFTTDWLSASFGINLRNFFCVLFSVFNTFSEVFSSPLGSDEPDETFSTFLQRLPRWRRALSLRCSLSRHCGRGSSYWCFDTASVPDQKGHCSSTASCSETSHFLISPLPMEPLCSS